MAGDPDKLYSVQKTMMWFAIASIVLTVSLVLMMVQDYNREWKDWQRKFVVLEREKVQTELKEARAKVDPKTLETLQADQKKAQAERDQNRGRHQTLTAEKAKLAIDLTQARSRYQDLKQYYDSAKFFLEESRGHHDDAKAKEYEARFAGLGPELEKAKLRQEELEKKDQVIDAEINGLQSKVKEIDRKIGQLLRDQKLLEKKLNKLKPSMAQDMLNAPMVDFVAPSLQIQQVVLEDLHDDLYFAKAQKVDRCTTCHLAIDRKGFEDVPQPFRTHPRLDLFLSAGSKHPLEQIGCTVCHGGNGHSVNFVYAAHTPHDEKQKEEWEKKYHWHELEKWENKMLPLQHAQASCTKCHTGTLEVPEAPKLNEGRRLAQASGCFGCHTVKGFESRWKVGPDLRHIQSKVDREWMIRWLENPKNFRPSTKMPQIFHLDNTNSREDRLRSDIAIEGITAYLMKNSDPVKFQTPPAAGDPEIGKSLVSELGCLGCHSLGEAKANDHGPELTRLGSKVSREWLFTWLKNPKHYSPDSRMPNLRLSDEEAAHMASFLLKDRHQAFDAQQIPVILDQQADDFALEIMSRQMRRSEALEQLQKMDTAQKFEFVGKEMIAQQGCFGCHAIKGFEAAKPIGTELTKEGQKQVDKFDFGFIDIERTREAWFHQKLMNPRIFDRDRIREYHEKLRMPHFGFTDGQAEPLMTFLLSLREEPIPLGMRKQLNLREQEIEAGRLLAAKLNCQGCHTLDHVEGRVRPLYPDAGNAPPVLDGEGAKVEEAWLHRFLKAPTPIRPWLKIRMPSFSFTDDEADLVVKYFAGLSGSKVSFAPASQPTDEALAVGKDLFAKFRCIQCHQSTGAPGLTASFLAPDLAIARERLKPDWVVEWLKDPQVLQPGTMMPTFFPDGQTPFADILGGDPHQQIQAIRDYMMTSYPEETVPKP